jgi:hypothetical protein
MQAKSDESITNEHVKKALEKFGELKLDVDDGIIHLSL